MVVQIVSLKCELDNIESLSVPADHEWVFDIRLTASDEVRTGVKVSTENEVEIPNSRGNTNLVIKVGKNIYATITVEDAPKIVKKEVSLDDSGKRIPLFAVDCRGCEIVAWHPTGYYSAVSVNGTRFDHVDLSEKEWYDVDTETNEPVSITNVESFIDRK